MQLAQFNFKAAGIYLLIFIAILECAIPTLWGSRVIGTANGSSGPMEFAFDGEAVSFTLIALL